MISDRWPVREQIARVRQQDRAIVAWMYEQLHGSPVQRQEGSSGQNRMRGIAE